MELQPADSDNITVSLTLSEAAWLDSPYHRRRPQMAGAVQAARMSCLAYLTESGGPGIADDPYLVVAYANGGEFEDVGQISYDAIMLTLVDDESRLRDGVEPHVMNVTLTPQQLAWVGIAARISYESEKENLLKADPTPGFLSDLRAALLLAEGEETPDDHILWAASEDSPQNRAMVDDTVSEHFRKGLQRLQTATGVMRAVAQYFRSHPELTGE